MNIESLTGFLFALIIWVLIPGPAVFAIVGRALTSPPASVIKLITGILLGDLFYITIALFGMAAIGKILGEFFFIIRMVGAAYLIFLGLQLWFRPPASPGSVPGPVGRDRYQSFLTGFSITLGNPKAILFHLGFLPTFFNLQAMGPADAVLIILVFVSVLGTALSMYAYTAAKARSFIENQQKIRILNRFAGTMLIGTGAALAAVSNKTP